MSDRDPLASLLAELAALHDDLEDEIYDIAHNVHELDRVRADEGDEARKIRIDAHRQSAVHHTMVAFMRSSELRTMIRGFAHETVEAKADRAARIAADATRDAKGEP